MEKVFIQVDLEPGTFWFNGFSEDVSEWQVVSSKDDASGFEVEAAWKICAWLSSEEHVDCRIVGGMWR